MIKKGFTLIELLVVIAIIAILAAILFPVFASAKDSAKDTAALNNVKQLSMAMLIYTNDYDDQFSPFVTNPFFTDSTGSATTGGWQSIIRPYTKNMQLAYHPKSPSPASNDTQKWIKEWQFWGVVPAAGALNIKDASGQVYYVNGTRTAGIDCLIDGPFGAAVPSLYNNTVTWPSKSQTQIENIAEAIMIAESTSYDMSWGRTAHSGGKLGSFFGSSYAATQNAYGTNVLIGGPTARKRWTGSSGTNGVNLIPVGQTTYAATDGSAKTVDYRGRIFERATLSTGQCALKRMYTPGGF